MLPYKDPSLSVEERVTDLLNRMTLEEKVGQLMQLDGREDLESAMEQYQPGSLLHILGEPANEAIRMAARTRLGIPVLFAEDAIHGHSFWPGATIFPTQLALACSWNPDLLRQVARVTARELSCTGPRWTFSPVLCLTRDLRWGRVGETFGEDPYLIGEFGAAMIQGYQGEDWTAPDSVLATAKHYAGYSETQGGRDASEADLSRRKLRSYFLSPFERAAKSGCMAFMTGYQAIEGVPSTANRWLLTEVLKEEWGFRGILVTDWDNVGRMHWEQKICPTMKEAAALAVRSGNDLMMATPKFYQGALDAVREGLITEGDIDAVCRRILGLKFQLGLFENPGVSDPAQQQAIIGCTAHREVALEAARQSIVLLQNKDDLLPLAREGERRVAVIGPNADDAFEQLGDWSLGSGQMEMLGDRHPRDCTETILDGLRALAPETWDVCFARGCNVRDADTSGIAEAASVSAAADVAVVVVGDQIPFIGEYCSTATLELQGGQLELLRALAATGTTLVVVLVNSKPLVLPPEVRAAGAIIECFNPGMRGGRALAEVLFGEVNPSGKLTVSFPVHVGQQPVFYSQVRGQHGNRYADLTQEPLFPFGHGLSYTSFEYSDLRVVTPEVPLDQTARFEITLKNTGSRRGSEVAQLYIQDVYTSVTWVQKQLKAFERVTLDAGEMRTLRFEVAVQDLWLIDADENKVVERGLFEVMIGGSSRESELLKANFEVV